MPIVADVGQGVFAATLMGIDLSLDPPAAMGI